MAAATSSAFSHEELIADKVTFQRRRLTPIDESTRDVSTRHVVSLVTCLEAPKNEILKFWRQQREPKTQPAGTAPRGSHVARAQRDDLLLRDLVAPLSLSGSFMIQGTVAPFPAPLALYTTAASFASRAASISACDFCPTAAGPHMFRGSSRPGRNATGRAAARRKPSAGVWVDPRRRSPVVPSVNPLATRGAAICAQSIRRRRAGQVPRVSGSKGDARV